MKIKKDIAIIGMAGRFPDANHLNQLYENLKAGKDSVNEISPGRLKDTALPLDREYKVCGYLEDIDKFDYELFNISKGEAQTMAPEQRLLLEVVYETFENSGYNVDYFDGSDTAVFMSEAPSNYYEHADEFLPTLVSGNFSEYLAPRICRQFNLTGSAVALNTSCSSFLVAVHLACNELFLGNTSCALICAANLAIFPFKGGRSRLDLDSPDGKSRAFSASANGMSIGEVVGAILLKPLDQALKDNDIIHAVIKGAAVNNNANRSASPTAPDSVMQARVLREAWKTAGIDPTDIGYIETHGSGTQLGDCLEIEGLDLAFRSFTSKKKICPISTIKSNVGHGRFAAGFSGLIKTVLSLKHKVLFPTIHFDEPNPMIDFENSAVYVNEKFRTWEKQQGKPRYAGITSVGASGINCHMVLQEPPAPNTALHENDSHTPPYLITVSSKTANGLKRNLEKLNQNIDPRYHLSDIGFTLNKGRKHYNYRFAVISNNVDALKEELHQAAAPINTPVPEEKAPAQLKKLFFIFSDPLEIPGSLVDYFLSRYPIFNRNFLQCRELYPGDSGGNFLSFALQYSLYKLLEAYGVTTDSILNTGTGTMVGAVIRGKKSLSQAVTEIHTYKSEKMQDLAQRVEAMLERETETEPVAFIQVGPESILSAELKKNNSPDSNFHVFSLPLLVNPAEHCPFLELLKDLYLANYNIDWDCFYQHHTGRKTQLPPYQFEKTRCWLRDEPKSAAKKELQPALAEEKPALEILEEAAETEQKIAEIWQEILELNRFSLAENFFELGGDSLKATRVINRINETFMLELSFEDIFDFPTIGSLAEYIDGLWGTQKKVEAIWRNVLKVEAVQPRDSFFDLGGHSLMANQVLNLVKQMFHLELNFEEFFRNPTLESFSQYIDSQLAKGTQTVDYKRIEPAEKKERYPVSSAQNRLFLLQQLEPQSTSYNLSYVMHLDEDFSVERLEETFKKLIIRHESLRTSFEITDTGPVQRIHEAVDFSVAYHEAGEDENEKIVNYFKRPFDLNQAPLIRAAIVGKESSRPMLLIDMHHIITDGSSQGILADEFMALYSSEELPPLRLHYKDYAQWRSSREQQELIRQQEQYWLKTFSGEKPVLNLPTDYERPAMQSFEGSSVSFQLDQQETRILKQIAREADTTLFMGILAVFIILLSKLSGQEDIIVGTPTAGRRHADLEGIIGMFVNTLAVRTFPRENKTLKQFLQEVKERTLEAFNNQEYQFENLVDKLLNERDPSRNPIFDVVFNFLNHREFKDLDTDSNKDKNQLYTHKRDSSQFDINLSAIDYGERVWFNLEYCTKLFKLITIERFISYFKTIVSSLSTSLEQELSDIEIVSGQKQEEFLTITPMKRN